MAMPSLQSTAFARASRQAADLSRIRNLKVSRKVAAPPRPFPRDRDGTSLVLKRVIVIADSHGKAVTAGG